MMWPLRQSTASQEIPLGPFVDSTDGNTQETALTIANTDIKLFKSGATTEASKNSGGATHIANGRYYAVLDATDTGTLGPMRVYVHVAGALAVWLDCMVYNANVYDWLMGAGAVDVNVKYWNDGTAVATPHTAGYPAVTLKSGTGTGELNITAGTVNFIRSSTAQAGSASSLTLDTGASSLTNNYKGLWLVLLSGTGAGQCRAITSYDGTTKVASITPDWNTIPDSTTGFSVIPAAGVNVELWRNNVVNVPISGRIDASAQEVADKTNYTAALTSGGLDALLRTPLTETYAGPGAAPTLEQFMFMLHSALSEFAISSTTVTCKKLDGSTTAMTFTLDDASNPTSRTRAT